MITRFDKFNLIKESPDQLEIDAIDADDEGESFNCNDADAIPFFASVDENHSRILRINIGKYGSWHNAIPFRGKNKAFAGRLWENSKIMSFWVYPNVELFKQIIKKLEKKLGLKIFNNGWRLEVVIDDDSGDINRVEYDPDIKDEDEDFFFRPDDQMYGDNKIIPIEEYVGSEDQPEELMIQHMLSWQEKEKLKKEKGVKGFGSAKTAWDKPHNIKYRRAIYQENKKY
jgi:hypothetical protein